MSPKAAVHENRFAGIEMWFLSLATMVLAVGALLVIMWEPMALGLALGVGLLAVGARSLFVRIRESAHEKAEASSAVANAGLAMAAVSIAPLLLFAFLWAALLVLLGVMWLLSAIGVI
jgi:hypothetical protein